MIRSILPISALLMMTACGDGAPFGALESSTPIVATTSSDIPGDIAGNQTAFLYDPTTETLQITGTFQDGDEETTTYRRRPALDRGDYQAYTAQDDPTDVHATAYVRTVGAVTSSVTITGGQFGRFRGGTGFTRTGDFSSITASESTDTGLVTYAGRYVGVTNVNGERTDIAPISVRPALPGEPPVPTTIPGVTVDPTGVAFATIPNQAGVVDGTIFINVALDDPSGNVTGIITERTVNSLAANGSVTTLNVQDLVLGSSDLTADGQFNGPIEPVDRVTSIGSYAGLIGGTQAEAIAGSLVATEHFGDNVTDTLGNPISIDGEEEYGIFVIGRCNGPSADVSAECSIAE